MQEIKILQIVADDVCTIYTRIFNEFYRNYYAHTHTHVVI